MTNTPKPSKSSNAYVLIAAIVFDVVVFLALGFIAALVSAIGFAFGAAWILVWLTTADQKEIRGSLRIRDEDDDQ